jgi:hypothetical protein
MIRCLRIGFERFIPDPPGMLAEGGRLQALVIGDMPGGDTRNWESPAFSKRRDRSVHWINMEDTHNPEDDMRNRGDARGAALFARGEGVYAGKGVSGRSQIHFTCTSGGGAQIGQIMRYTPSVNEGSQAASGAQVAPPQQFSMRYGRRKAPAQTARCLGNTLLSRRTSAIARPGAVRLGNRQQVARL